MDDDRGLSRRERSFSAFERPSVLWTGLLFLFHRLFEAEAFAVHFKDLAMVRESIQQGGCHAFSLKDLAPVAERQVAGDQQAATFVSISEYLKQQFGSRSTERQVPEFIDDQQIEFVEPLQHAIQCKLFLSFFELIHKRRRGEEFGPQSVSTRGEPQRNREMRLTGSGLTQQANVTSPGNPFAAR